MNPPNENRAIAFSQRFYKRLLRLYPRAHREEYGDAMAQLFRDRCRDAWKASRGWGLAWLWLRVLPDAFKTAACERLTNREERKYIYCGLLFAIALFLSGTLICYFALLPAARAASQMYSDWLGFSHSYWDTRIYLRFASKFMLGMGLAFELPLVILTLVKIGVLSHRALAKARPYMIVINLVLGRVFTTLEVLTCVLMAVPLQLLFEISVWIAWHWERKGKNQQEQETT